MPEELETHSEDWYVTQYNRNRDSKDWVKNYNEFKKLMNALNKRDGRQTKMKCNVVVRSDRPGKKKMVKACENGKEKLIHFGAKGYGHNYSGAARKSFRARHKCGTAKSKTDCSLLGV